MWTVRRSTAARLCRRRPPTAPARHTASQRPESRRTRNSTVDLQHASLRTVLQSEFVEPASVFALPPAVLRAVGIMAASQFVITRCKRALWPLRLPWQLKWPVSAAVSAL